MDLYVLNTCTCMHIDIYMYLTSIYRYVKVHTKLNDLSHDEKLIIHSEIQNDLEAMFIKCIFCEGKP